MKSSSTASRITTLVVATLLFVLTSSMAWATLHDFGSRGTIPAGVTLAGTELGGMSSGEARDAIRTAVAAPLLKPVVVTADSQTVMFDPRSSVSIDVDAMVDQAFSSRRRSTYLQRVVHDLTGSSLPLAVQPRYSIDEGALDSWLADVATRIDTKSRDASVTVADGVVRIKPSVVGRRTDVEAGGRALRAAFTFEGATAAEARRIVVPVETIQPRITEGDVGKTIVVDLSQRRIRLYDGDKLEKTYPCAIGAPSYPTPQGVFVITQKRYMPTWVNPAPNGWGADMPRSIPPGWGNPLGTRALNLSASAIRFHGTANIGSIGTAASKGCMRMRMADIEDFYRRVRVGTKVHILP